MNEQERAAYRAFVRDHHPDRGGDPDAFVAGLARFRDSVGHTAGGHTAGDTTDHTADDPRFDAPVEVVAPLPFPVRVGVALIRTWHRRRNHRVQ